MFEMSIGQSSGGMGNTAKSWIAPVVNAAANIAGGLFGWIGNRKQRKHEQKMYHQQWQDSIKMWNLENQYNSPAMQMKRLKDAGLNPNLVYGQGADATGDTIQRPQMDVSQARAVAAPINPAGIMQDMYNMRQTDAQTRLAEQQIKTQASVEILNGYNAQLTALNAELAKTNNEFARRTLEDRIKNVELQQKEMIAKIENYGAGTASLNQSTEESKMRVNKLVQDITFAAQKQPHEVSKLLAEISNIYSSTNKIKAELGLIAQNISESEMREFNGALEAALTQTGYNKNDSAFQRILKGMLRSAYTLGNMKEAKRQLRELQEWIKKHRK